MNRICFFLMLVFSLTFCLSGQAGTTSLRLVDARWNVPLEFWERTEASEQTSVIRRWCLPSKVWIDGKPLVYGHYGKDNAAVMGTDDGGKVEGMEDLEKELSGAAVDDKLPRSDRASQVVGGTGVKASMNAELGEGEHVVYPGGFKFKLDKTGVAQVSGSLVKSGSGSIILKCRTVDIGLPTAGYAVSVQQGGHLVFDGKTEGQGPQVLRIFLPVSEEEYSVQVPNAGEVRIKLGPDSLSVSGTPKMDNGWQIDASGGAVTFYQASSAPAPRAAAEPKADGAELYLFTDRNRAVFAEGERVQVSVRAFGPAAGGDKVALILEGEGQKIELSAQQMIRSGSAVSAELELDTKLLRPGEYKIQASWNGAKSNPLPVKIVSLMPDTNLTLFGYNKWGSSSFKDADLAAAVNNGLNLVVQGGSGAQGGHVMGAGSPFSDWSSEPRPIDKERLKEFQKANIPPELLELTNEHDSGAEFLLANGIRNMPIACPLILYFNIGAYWKHHADDRYQAVQHMGQEWRRFPNFLGAVHTTGDGPTPATMGMVWAAGAGSFDIIHDERMAKLKEVFEFKVGKVKIDDSAVKAEFEKINGQMTGAIGYGVGMNTGAKVEGDDAVKIEWHKWISDLYPNTFREERKALSALMEKPMLNCSWTWGAGIGGGMIPESFYQALDNPVIDLHGDFGIVPLCYSTGSDTLTVGQTSRPWISMDLLLERPLANGMKLFLEGLSRNPAGIGALNTKGEVAGGWGYAKEASEGMSILMDIGRRFGDVFMQLKRNDEIAIISSFRQAALDGQAPGILYGAHFLATKSGYQPVILSEEDVLKDAARLNKCKAVFLVSMTKALPQELKNVLTAFQKQGGRVIADEKSKVDLPGVLSVSVIELNGANEVNFRNVYNAFEPLIAKFRATVNPVVKTFFTSTAPHVHMVRSADADLEWWTAFNDTMPDPQPKESGHFIQFLYKGMEAELGASRGGVLYDALRRQTVETKGGKDGMTWHADMRLLPGTVYLCADRPLAALSVNTAKELASGSILRMSTQVSDDAGKAFAGRLPVEVVISNPAGVERYRVYRTTNQDLEFKIAGNDPAGQWTWTVTEQATGLQAKGGFTVTGATVAPAVAKLDELVYDAKPIHDALRSREMQIILFPEQLALKATAENLATKLQASGVKAKVRIIWPALVRPYPMNWKELTVEDDEIHQSVLSGDILGVRVRGKNQEGTWKADPMKHAFYGQYTGSSPLVYYHDVILMGRADLPGNPMLDLITQRARMLPRNPSPSFPASGSGFAAYAWGPFHYGNDAVIVYGHDAAGLDKAVASVIALADAKTEPAASPLIRLACNTLENGKQYETMGIKLSADAAGQPVKSSTRISDSLLPPVFDSHILQAAATNGRVVLKMESRTDLAVPPFVVTELATGKSKRLNSDDKPTRALGIEPLMRGEAAAWSTPLVQRVAGGRIVPVGRGIARIDEKNGMQWFFDPFPVSETYEEVKFTRRCQQFLLSPDEKSLLAVFYDANGGGNYGPGYRMFNQGASVLLDAATGREICRYPGFLAGPLVMSADGSRCVLGDDVEQEDQGRGLWNKYGGKTIAAFDNTGKELSHLPGDRMLGIAASRDASLAVVTYSDPRRYVSIYDTKTGREIRIRYPRVDLAAAVAPDASFAVVTYADGMVRKLSPDGKVLQDIKLPATGQPTIGEDGVIAVCANDGKIYFPGSDKKPIDFIFGSVEKVSPVIEQIPPGLCPPVKPFWTALADSKGFKPEPLTAPAGGAALASFSGEKTLTVELPKMATGDVALLTFQYRMQDPKDELAVSFSAPDGGQKLSYFFPYFALAHPASIPVRAKNSGPVTLTFNAKNVEVTQLAMYRIKLSGSSNVARADVSKKSGNPNSPRAMIPNVQGCLGDPRVEQVAFGYPGKGSFALPRDMKGQVQTDIFTLFDGNISTGTPLYPRAVSGNNPWNPASITPTLRSARVIMEFAKPCTAEAFAVWESPGDLPVSTYTLEYATEADVKAGEKGEVPGNWKMAVEGRYNTDYFHLHAFQKPITARVWRYTIVDTPCAAQRVAELELYQSAVDALEGDMNMDGGTGAKGMEPGDL